LLGWTNELNALILSTSLSKSLSDLVIDHNINTMITYNQKRFITNNVDHIEISDIDNIIDEVIMYNNMISNNKNIDCHMNLTKLPEKNNISVLSGKILFKDCTDIMLTDINNYHLYIVNTKFYIDNNNTSNNNNNDDSISSSNNVIEYDLLMYKSVIPNYTITKKILYNNIIYIIDFDIECNTNKTDNDNNNDDDDYEMENTENDSNELREVNFEVWVSNGELGDILHRFKVEFYL
jgi:hypothetical protein